MSLLNHAPAAVTRYPVITKLICLCLALLCLTPLVTAPVALLMGIVMVNTIGHPFAKLNARLSKYLLQASVIGLGFGMDMHSALRAGREGILLTIASICGTLVLGYILGKALHIDAKCSFLISSGTAICGGSAIAAIAPVIKAEEKQISVALGTIFLLNALALFIFPLVGHALHLNQHQFGLWAAIAIHDTSSVIGAASRYGAQALNIATTVKLARALWIIPLSLGSALAARSGSGKIKIPWFILLFLLALVCNTYIPGISLVSHYLVTAAKAGLTLALFLIGAGLSFSMLRAVGWAPLLQGVLLWIAIGVSALLAVMYLV